MKTEKVESNSFGSIYAREEKLKTVLDCSEEVLLAIIGKFGLDSDKYQVADRFIEVVKLEYEFLVAKREYEAFCEQKQMRLYLDGLLEIYELHQVGKMIAEQHKKLQDAGLIS